MSFTREHFELVARVLNTAKVNLNHADRPNGEKQVVDWIAQDFIVAFQNENSRFDANKFLKAIG